MPITHKLKQTLLIKMYARSTRRLFSTASKKNVVLVDGCRIPFTLAGTAYKDYMAVDLGRS